MITYSRYFIFKNYIKYVDLKRLTLEAFANSEYGEAPLVNIYIDLSSMIDHLYRYDIIKDSKPIALTAAIINLAAHMRGYFLRYHNVYSNIFFCYSKNQGVYQRLMYPQWNEDMIKTRKANEANTKFLQLVLDSVRDLVAYLPSVYYIHSESECSGVIYATILKERDLGNDNPNIILTKEFNTFQIPAIDCKSFIYYKAAKFDSSATSYMISGKNVMKIYFMLNNRYIPNLDPSTEVLVDMFTDVTKTKFITKFDHVANGLIEQVNGWFLPLLIAITNLPSRKVKSLLSYNRGLKFISFIQNIPDLLYDAETIYHYLTKFYKGKPPISFSEFETRFDIVSVAHQAMIYRQSMEYNMDYRIDIDNPAELRTINDHVFKEYPLDLNRF